ANLIKLGTRDPNSGEYNVLLPGDFDEKIGEAAGETTAPETEKAARPARRGRGRRVQPADEDLSLEPLAGEAKTEETECAATTAAASATREATARGALRQGRLRSSGRTWKGKATTRSILQGALNGAGAPETAAAPEEEAEP